jgi:formate/nitrite transporter FocA (FNT family)
MSAYVFGNLAGRLFISYLVVWIGMLLVSRVNWRSAFRRTLRWYGVASVTAIFALGLAVAAT